MNELLNHKELFITVFLTLLISTYLLVYFFKQRINNHLKQKRAEQKRVYRAERKKKLSKAITEDDKSLFAELLTVLPFNSGSIEFLKHQDMGKAFHGSKLDDLYTFYYDWSNEEHTFPNQSLDEERKKIYSLVGKYIDILSKTLENTDSGHLKATRNIDLLKSTSNEIVESYKKFIERTEEKLLALTKPSYLNAIHNSLQNS